MDASWITVGFYLHGTGCSDAVAFEEYTESSCCSAGSSQVFVPFTPPSPYDSAIATGINGNGDVVGYTTKSGVYTGWFYTYFKYYSIKVPGAVSTQPLAVDWQDDVVGEYWDSTGTPHGFLVQNPGGNATYQNPIYFKNNSKYSETVPASIDDCDDIAGWYASGGVDNGFVATTSSAQCTIGSEKPVANPRMKPMNRSL